MAGLATSMTIADKIKVGTAVTRRTNGMRRNATMVRGVCRLVKPLRPTHRKPTSDQQSEMAAQQHPGSCDSLSTIAPTRYRRYRQTTARPFQTPDDGHCNGAAKLSVRLAAIDGAPPLTRMRAGDDIGLKGPVVPAQGQVYMVSIPWRR